MPMFCALDQCGDTTYLAAYFRIRSSPGQRLVNIFEPLVWHIDPHPFVGLISAFPSSLLGSRATWQRMRKFWLFHPTFSLFSVLYYWHQCVWKLFHNTRLDLFPYRLAPKNYFTKVFILVELCMYFENASFFFAFGKFSS